MGLRQDVTVLGEISQCLVFMESYDKQWLQGVREQRQELYIEKSLFDLEQQYNRTESGRLALDCSESSQ